MSAIRNYMVATAAVVIALPAFFGASQATAQETITLNLWSRPDNSGPLRPGNIVRGAENLNAVLESEGADFRVAINVVEVPSEGGFDGDAERLLRAFAIGEGPDMFITAHEWICAFADGGNAMDLTDFTKANPDLFGDIFESLWASTECGGQRFAVPQDAEARMFFYNKGLMRDAGYDEAFIEGLDEAVLAGDITLDDLSDIAAKVVSDTSAEFGILHRPSRGPDYLMIFQQYGST
ncbi:MAG: ABC transporter substrate-binding protein, partial [Alphaproteobacteria bacterium]